MRDKEIYRLLGRQIAQRRKERGLTQKELSERVEMSRASIANIERGEQNVLLHNLYTLASALEIADPAMLLPALPRASAPGDIKVKMVHGQISERAFADVNDMISKAAL